MPNIPTTSDEVLSASDDVYALVYSQLTGNGVPAFLAMPIAGVMSAIVMLGSYLRLSGIFLIKQIAVPVAISIVELISDIRKEGATEFAQVATEAMGEFMGMEVDPSQLATGQGAAASLQRARTIGGGFLDLLEHEFAPDGTVTPDSGAAGAKAFVGYSINFSATNAFISIISELLSLEHLEQFRELGVEIAQNIGLGRLVRRALAPLVDSTITKPYTRQLAAKYRPDRLSAAEYITALHAGRMSAQDVQTALTEYGFPDVLITELIAQHEAKFTLRDVYLLKRFGVLNDDTAAKTLLDLGWDSEFAAAKLQAMDFERIESLEGTLADELLSMVRKREIDTVTYTTELDKLHLSDKENLLRRTLGGVWLDAPHKRLTFAQIVTLSEHQLLTLDYLQQWTQAEGYSPDDQLNLELLLDVKEADFAAAEKRKADAAAAKAAKAAAKTPPKA